MALDDHLAIVFVFIPVAAARRKEEIVFAAVRLLLLHASHASHASSSYSGTQTVSSYSGIAVYELTWETVCGCTIHLREADKIVAVWCTDHPPHWDEGWRMLLCVGAFVWAHVLVDFSLWQSPPSFATDATLVYAVRCELFPGMDVGIAKARIKFIETGSLEEE